MYPQVPQQAAGLGFPLARITVLLSLATGACHDLAIAPYQGKGTGEKTLLRQMYDALKPGDVVVADAPSLTITSSRGNCTMQHRHRRARPAVPAEGQLAVRNES